MRNAFVFIIDLSGSYESLLKFLFLFSSCFLQVLFKSTQTIRNANFYKKDNHDNEIIIFTPAELLHL